MNSTAAQNVTGLPGNRQPLPNALAPSINNAAHREKLIGKPASMAPRVYAHTKVAGAAKAAQEEEIRKQAPRGPQKAETIYALIKEMEPAEVARLYKALGFPAPEQQTPGETNPVELETKMPSGETPANETAIVSPEVSALPSVQAPPTEEPVAPVQEAAQVAPEPIAEVSPAPVEAPAPMPSVVKDAVARPLDETLMNAKPYKPKRK